MSLKRRFNPPRRGTKGEAMVIGIAGGAGCGKTTLARIFAGYGARVVDVDGLGHRLLWRRSPVYRKVVQRFGRGILGRQGAIERKKLGSLVFADPGEMMALNRIVHPTLKKELLSRIERLRLAGRKPIVVDAALLVDWGLWRRLDWLVAVTAPKKIRRQRLIAKGMAPKRAADIIRYQGSQKRVIKVADLVIENQGSLAQLKTKAQKVWEKITRGSARTG